MTLRRFHNALRILIGIDLDELRTAGVVIADDQWISFRDDPYRWFIRASDSDAEKVWKIIEARQKPVERPKPMSKQPETTIKNECWFCLYGKQPPGNSHFNCSNPDPDMTGNPTGVRRGWFIYPELFDPVWKTKKCSNFEVKPEPSS